MLRTGAALVLILLILYGGWKAWPLIRGPRIVIDSPIDYTSYPNGLITVSGVAHNTEALFLDGGPLPIDPEGHFTKQIYFPSGGSILTFTARDRFGRTETETRTVYIP
jgi:hypothetical protein